MGLPSHSHMLICGYDQGSRDRSRVRFEYADGRVPAAMIHSGTRYVIGTGQVGSPLALVDRGGRASKRIIHDSFGNVVSDDPPSSPCPSASPAGCGRRCATRAPRALRRRARRGGAGRISRLLTRRPWLGCHVEKPRARRGGPGGGQACSSSAARKSRFTVSFLRSTCMVSNRPGLAVLPVMATRMGWAICLKPRPCSSM